jgi:hypothetical protein
MEARAELVEQVATTRLAEPTGTAVTAVTAVDPATEEAASTERSSHQTAATVAMAAIRARLVLAVPAVPVVPTEPPERMATPCIPAATAAMAVRGSTPSLASREEMAEMEVTVGHSVTAVLAVRVVSERPNQGPLAEMVATAVREGLMAKVATVVTAVEDPSSVVQAVLAVGVE